MLNDNNDTEKSRKRSMVKMQLKRKNLKGEKKRDYKTLNLIERRTDPENKKVDK